MQQNKWMCNGIVEDGQQHPDQELQGIHKPYDNYGNDCVICHLTQEQVVGDASKSPFKAIAILLSAGIIAALGVGCGTTGGTC
jgi:phosphate transport system substrate-binding protein